MERDGYSKYPIFEDSSSQQKEMIKRKGANKRVTGSVKLSTDPQSVAARQRRHRISDRFKILKSLVPGGSKMDTVSMLEEAIHYVKYLKSQIWLHQAAMAMLPSSDEVVPTFPCPDVIKGGPSVSESTCSGIASSTAMMIPQQMLDLGYPAAEDLLLSPLPPLPPSFSYLGEDDVLPHGQDQIDHMI